MLIHGIYNQESTDFPSITNNIEVMKKLTLLTILSLFSLASHAQAAEVEMADTMRANGKIYVVVGIILIVLIGFIAYLFMLDRKLDRLEKEFKK